MASKAYYSIKWGLYENIWACVHNFNTVKKHSLNTVQNQHDMLMVSELLTETAHVENSLMAPWWGVKVPDGQVTSSTVPAGQNLPLAQGKPGPEDPV